MPFVNRAASKLSRQYAKRGAPARLAKEVDVDEGYLSRILSGERIPGMTVRRRFWDIKRVPMHWWDDPVPNSDRQADRKLAG